jgi:alkanesulfonate monooxygenase SsuD/methylene tetrahydromethanopterin reductase-like flavin-dependent oxidoreductase (luciferase family)
VKFGVNVPNFGEYSDPRAFASLAAEAEESGWDGVFVWDHILLWSSNTVGDPWILLAAAAAATERVLLGPMVTPIPRRRPWKLAREIVSLDHLSNGRVVLGVGIGFPPDSEFEAFGESADAKLRADLLDEGLEVLLGLWSGRPFTFTGRHYQIDEMTFLPVPVQQPRIPIWVAGMWPNRRPFRRAARYDGVFPIKAGEDMELLTPSELREIVEYVGRHRADAGPFDVVTWADLSGDASRADDLVAEWAESGATWIHSGPGDFGMEPAESFRQRVRSGPPGV